MNRLAAVVCFVTSLMVAAHTPAQPCQPHWSDEFGNGEMNAEVRALVTRDTPAGQELYAGGSFTRAGVAAAARVARWDGHAWHALGSGIDGDAALMDVRVYALAFYDDGTGPALYAGGEFTIAGGRPASYLAKWDGKDWSAVGGGVNGLVRALHVFDDGTGPALYVAGRFTRAGSVDAVGVAKWDGSAWDSLGGGMTGVSIGYALETFDDGAGPGLYLGGDFTSVGGVPASRIARWNGQTWSALGSGVNTYVLALAAEDLGDGPALYVGGSFTVAGGVVSFKAARWKDSAWHPMGTSLVGAFVTSFGVYGAGPVRALYAGMPWGSAPEPVVKRWTGSSWIDAGAGLPANSTPRALTIFEAPEGPVMVVGGSLGVNPNLGVAVLRGSPHWGVGMFRRGVTGGTIKRLAVADTGAGPELFATGSLTHIGGVPCAGLARREGAGWTGIGFVDGATVEGVAVLDSGSGPVLYAAGSFPFLGTTNFDRLRVAKRTHDQWDFLSRGNGPPIAVMPGAPSAVLYAGLSTAVGITPYSGGAWGPSTIFIGSEVNRLIVQDRGVGPSLYVTGRWIAGLGTLRLGGIAALERGEWSNMDGGVETASGWIADAAVFDDGRGPALYIAGPFFSAGGLPAAGVARWDGFTWTALGSGLSGGPGLALAVFDDGINPESLYVGGIFAVAGGVPAKNLARWDGRTWSAVGGGVEGPVETLAVTSGPEGRSLWVGGQFAIAGGVNTSGIARWIACPPSACYANCDGSTGPGGGPTLGVSDFVCFLNRFASGDPLANCDGSSVPPVLNVADFVCFQSRFAVGCP